MPGNVKLGKGVLSPSVSESDQSEHDEDGPRVDGVDGSSETLTNRQLIFTSLMDRSSGLSVRRKLRTAFEAAFVEHFRS
jgi:hypothetical protein